MSALHGTIRNGQIILDAPVDPPEGTRAEIPACPARTMNSASPGRVRRDFLLLRR
jgi:hypothetical protein